MAKLASRESILGLQDINYTDVDMSEIPGWEGIVVRLRDLSGRERDALEKSVFVEKRVRGNDGKVREKQELRDNIRATFIAACAIDESGTPLFAKEDISRLGQKSARALDKLFNVIRDRNGISNQDVEEMVENFESGQDSASSIA